MSFEIFVVALQHRLASGGMPSLVAATLDWNAGAKHLRFNFFFSGTTEGVDFDRLEFDVVGQMIAQIWGGVETVGFAAIFDQPSTMAALADPDRLYPP